MMMHDNPEQDLFTRFIVTKRSQDNIKELNLDLLAYFLIYAINFQSAESENEIAKLFYQIDKTFLSEKLLSQLCLKIKNVLNRDECFHFVELAKNIGQTQEDNFIAALEKLHHNYPENQEERYEVQQQFKTSREHPATMLQQAYGNYILVHEQSVSPSNEDKSVYALLMRFVADNKLESVNSLLNELSARAKKQMSCTAKRGNNYSLLETVILLGNPALFERIITEFAYNKDNRDDEGWTLIGKVLYICEQNPTKIHKGHQVILNELLAYSAPLDQLVCIQKKNPFKGYYPLHLAIRTRSQLLVNAMLTYITENKLSLILKAETDQIVSRSAWALSTRLQLDDLTKLIEKAYRKLSLPNPGITPKKDRFSFLSSYKKSPADIEKIIEIVNTVDDYFLAATKHAKSNQIHKTLKSIIQAAYHYHQESDAFKRNLTTFISNSTIDPCIRRFACDLIVIIQPTLSEQCRILLNIAAKQTLKTIVSLFNQTRSPVLNELTPIMLSAMNLSVEQTLDTLIVLTQHDAKSRQYCMDIAKNHLNHYSAMVINEIESKVTYQFETRNLSDLWENVLQDHEIRTNNMNFFAQI